MNGPSLQRLTILSFIFHVTFFGMTFIALKQSARFVMPSPYVVNLVDSDIRSEAPPAAGTQAVTQSPAPEVVKPVKEEAVSPSPKEVKKLNRKEERDLQDRISALEAKKKIAKMAKLRNELKNVIPMKGGTAGGRAGSSRAASGGKRDGVTDDYYAKVHQRIWNKWGVPSEIKEKKLEAIVSIRIRRDGSVEIIGIDQKSGSSVFDRSALAAIKDASPLPPPPYEMEIGVRFYP